jgi:hypothetical protein
MRKRKYLIGATLGVLGALIVSGTAYAGAPTGQTLQTTLAPSKQDKKVFGGASLHNVIATTYSDFNNSPPAKETIFSFGKDLKFVNGNLPPCSLSTLNAATSTAAVTAACGASVVGTGTDEVNNKTGLFPNPNPVMLVSGGPTTLYVWTRINNALTLVLTGAYSASAHTLDVTGLPFTLGTDLTLFDTQMTKKKTGKSTFYVMARCGKKKKWVVSETTTYYNTSGGTGTSITATSTQKCKQKPSKK